MRRFGKRATAVAAVPPVFEPPPLPALPEPEEGSEPAHIIDAANVRSDTGLAEEDRNSMRRLLDKIFDSEN